jgi:hypothetical protein
MEETKVNGEVIAVLPNKVKIKVDDLNAFKGAEQLKVVTLKCLVKRK